MLEEGDEALGEGARALWGKTARGSRGRGKGDGWHPLACHVIDSAVAAGWVWDEFLSPGTRAIIDAAAGRGAGSGRVLLQWLAAMHDLGKATPSFQVRDESRSRPVQSAGLRIAAGAAESEFSHAHLSGRLLWDLTRTVGWERRAANWSALTEAGHHGVFPAENWRERQPYDWEIGVGPWAMARDQLVALACAHVGIRGRCLAAVPVPDLSLQVVLSGAVILADWIASNEDVFPYTSEWQDGYPAVARTRSAGIAAALEMRDKWRPDQASPVMGAASLYPLRFSFIDEPRPVQEAAYSLAAVDGAGLLLIEAPMGEGKTEAALVAAEVMAALTGADGLFVGLPSKATANQMFSRVTAWLDPQPGVPVVTLAHSGARRHQAYRDLLQGIGVDEGDCGVAASQWLAGSKKALLAPVTIGTIDQLLLAGVSSRHVSLRHLGLCGKVVIVDEVHACDAYMSAILGLVLRWLGAARIPVILLSATLATRQRQSLLAAYAGTEITENPRADGYPRLSWVTAPAERRQRRNDASDCAVMTRTQAATADRRASVAVTMIDERDGGTIPELATELVSGGGCALMVRNTVRRAQDTYRELRKTRDPAEVMLIHARFTVADRRAREERLVGMFGKSGQRPERSHITVGTQVLEQSLDCDWDVLLTDLAPVDLLLQRLGRVHRHNRPEGCRGRMTVPRLYVAGRDAVPGAPPRLPPGSSLVYTDHLLWRTEAVLTGRAQLEIPQDIPELIDLVYGSDLLGPPEWQAAMAAAAAEANRERERRAAEAATIMLPQPDEAASLASIHRLNVGEAREDAEASGLVQAHVRIGPPTIEVMLLRAAGPGSAVTVSGDTPDTAIPLGRVPPGDLIEAALGQLIRLPAQLTAYAAKTAAPRPTWARSASLARVPVLLLPAAGGPIRLGPYRCSYSPDLGLEVTNA
jgi:CRISPR-associated helicase Cas3/CRISPR-associated endonuclease Cas3-HD